MNDQNVDPRPTTVTVDRAVLADLLRIAAANEKLDWEGESKELYRLADEVEQGKRAEIHATDYPFEVDPRGWRAEGMTGAFMESES